MVEDSSRPYFINSCSAAETEGLFGGSYFELVRDALKPDGITITQSKSPVTPSRVRILRFCAIIGWGIWVELRPPMMLLKENMRWHRNLFPSVDYYTLAAPSFTCGQAGKKKPQLTPRKEFVRAHLRYYYR